MSSTDSHASWPGFRYLLIAAGLALLGLAGYAGYAAYPRFQLPAAEGLGLYILASGDLSVLFQWQVLA